jgi:6-phosphogluconolactonase
MIRRLLQTVSTISIVALIAGCKPARFVYAVGYIAGGERNIQTNPALVSGFDITATTGALNAITGSPWSAATGPFVLRAAVTPSGQFLYVSNFDLDDIWGYSIDATGGALTPVPGSPFHLPAAAGPSGVAVDSSGSFLYVAAISGSSAGVTGFTINSTTGALMPITGSPFGTGFVNPYAIAVNGDFVYVTDIYNDSISVLAINTSTGVLTQISGSPFPTGITPQSIAVDPLNGGYVYVANNSDNTVSGYSINASTGALTPVTGSPFKAGIGPLSDAVAIEVNVDLNSAVDPIDVRSFLYVANGSENDVSGFSVDQSSGGLTPISGSPFKAGTGPGSVAVDPAGHFLYVGNLNSENVSAFSVDDLTGILTPVAGSPFPVGDNVYAVVTTAGP